MKIIKTTFCIYFLLFFLNTNGQPSNDLSKPKFIYASEALGYLEAQQQSLSRIKREFPQLIQQCQIAEMRFNSVFGTASSRIESYLSNYFGKKKYEEIRIKMTNEVTIAIKNQILNEKIVLEYISEIENRAKGNIKSPILETLLSFQFSEKPELEFLSGFTKVYKTSNHPKAKNTDWQIRVPMSWKAIEGNRPNIIQKFVSDNGSGLQMMLLLVKDIPVPNGSIISQEEINNFFSEQEIKSIVPEDGNFISYKKMNFDGFNGGMLEFEQEGKQLDMTNKVRMIQYMFIYKGKLYSLQTMVLSSDSKTDLSDSMQKYFTLFQLVANSIVVNDQYK